MELRGIIFAAACICVLAASAAAVAQVECEPAGAAKKLQVPFVRAHAPCGFHGHEPDGSTSLGSSCSSATVGTNLLVGSCNTSAQACTTNSECSQMVCATYHPGAFAAAPCDDQGADCSPCDQYGNCGGTTCFDVGPYGGQACGTAENTYDSSYEFGPKGSCTLTAKSKAVKSCATVEDSAGNALGLPDVPCHNTYVAVRCKDLRRQDGALITGATDDGFELRLHPRLTLGDSTIVDLPLVQLPFSTPLDGSMELESSLAEAFVPMFYDSTLPTCTTMELGTAEIVDADDNILATVGLATR